MGRVAELELPFGDGTQGSGNQGNVLVLRKLGSVSTVEPEKTSF